MSVIRERDSRGLVVLRDTSYIIKNSYSILGDGQVTFLRGNGTQDDPLEICPGEDHASALRVVYNLAIQRDQVEYVRSCNYLVKIDPVGTVDGVVDVVPFDADRWKWERHSCYGSCEAYKEIIVGYLFPKKRKKR